MVKTGATQTIQTSVRSNNASFRSNNEWIHLATSIFEGVCNWLDQLDNPVCIRRDRDGPLRGFAHLTEDRTRAILTHNTFGSERLFWYAFESPNQSLRVLDHIIYDIIGSRGISRILIEVMCFVFLAQTLRKFGQAQDLVFAVMATLFFATFLHRYQWTE